MKETKHSIEFEQWEQYRVKELHTFYVVLDYFSLTDQDDEDNDF